MFTEKARGEGPKELEEMQASTSGGAGGPAAAGLRDAEALAFAMASDLGRLKRKIDVLGTARDTPQHREELAALNRGVQATAKQIKQKLEALSREQRGAAGAGPAAAGAAAGATAGTVGVMSEAQQAKLRKLVQDFAATLQDYKAAQKVAAEREAQHLPRVPPQQQQQAAGSAAAAAAAAAAGTGPREADVEAQALLQEQRLRERRALDGAVSYQEALIEERDQGIAEIQRQIGEVNEMFQDLAVLINDQGQQLTTVDLQIATAAERAREGTRQLVKAERSQRAARNKCLVLWAVSAIVLALILIILFG